jgi:hypothetical protein
VAQIRTFAEHGRPGFARSELRALVELVTSRLEAGRIDEAQAAEIIAAARAVADQLALVPRAAPSPSSSPVPEVDEGGGGNKGDKGDGHGDEGHGKDD